MVRNAAIALAAAPFVSLFVLHHAAAQGLPPPPAFPVGPPAIAAHPPGPPAFGGGFGAPPIGRGGFGPIAGGQAFANGPAMRGDVLRSGGIGGEVGAFRSATNGRGDVLSARALAMSERGRYGLYSYRGHGDYRYGGYRYGGYGYGGYAYRSYSYLRRYWRDAAAAYYPYSSEGYSSDSDCHTENRRVQTRYGWRVRSVEVCD